MFDKKTIAVVCILMAITFVAGYLVKQELDSGMREDQQWYRSHIVFKSGMTNYNGTEGLNYDLVSVDGGKNFAVRNRDGSFAGDVMVVYPGLKEQLEAWDVLMGFVTRSKPLDPSNSTQMQMLKSAGINVSIEKNTTSK